MDTLSLADIAYVAGVLDSQGIVRLRETPDGTRLPYVGLSCPNMGLLDYLAELTGTKVTLVRRSYNRLACSEHCEEPHLHVQSVTGRWSVSGAKATVVLAAILPYVRFQKTEIAELLSVGLAAPKKPATPAKMTALGWPDPWTAAA